MQIECRLKKLKKSLDYVSKSSEVLPKRCRNCEERVLIHRIMALCNSSSISLEDLIKYLHSHQNL